MGITRIISLTLVALLAFWPAYAQELQPARGIAASAEAAPWKSLVQSLEPAAIVKVRLANGRTLKGTILSTRDESLTMQVRTRIPVAPQVVPFDQVVGVERTHVGMNPGMKVLIGAGAIAGAAVLLMAAIFAASYD